MRISFNDGLESGGRKPVLWIVYRGQIQSFAGKNIPGVAVIVATDFVKNGKWSNTTYQIELAPGAIACQLLAPLHGQVWPENHRFVAYERFVRDFGVVLSFENFDNALERNFPKSRARMIEGEKALEALDQNGSGETELIEISTSKSCNRNPHSDVQITATDGRSWIIAHEAPIGTEIPGVCKLVQTKNTPGYQGGITTLTLAVSGGAIVTSLNYPKDGQAHSWALGRGGDGTPQ